MTGAWHGEYRHLLPYFTINVVADSWWRRRSINRRPGGPKIVFGHVTAAVDEKRGVGIGQHAHPMVVCASAGNVVMVFLKGHFKSAPVAAS